MRNRSVVLGVTIVALLVFAGCGGGSSPAGNDREQVTEVVHDYGKAFADGDYGKACDLMTSEGKAQLEKAAVFLGATGGCENALEAASKQLDPADKAKFKTAAVTTVRVNGDQATARYEGSPDPVQLRKKGGDWLVDIPASGS